MRASRGGDGGHDPSARALAAMAEAAERSRQTATDSNRPSSSGRSRRWPTAALVASVAAAVVVAVAVAVTTRHTGTPVASSHSAPAPHSSPAAGSHPTTAQPANGATPATAPPTTVPPTTVPTTTAPTTTVPPPASAPAASSPPTPTNPTGSSAGPELSSLAPSTGTAGQVLVVNGANLLSASGQITAQVGGENALIACPTSTSCLLQVPAPTGASTSVPVTVTTDGGTSNALSFTYG